jgi:chemotaxis protein MotA
VKDNWTTIAIGGALACVLVSFILDGGNPAVLVKPAPLLLVFGGTFFAGTAGYMKSDIKSFTALLKVATQANVFDAEITIQELSRLAGIAKRKGVLELERESKSLDDPFIRRACELAADGTSSDEIREVLEAEVDGIEARHAMGTKLFADFGGFAPTLGIIGTVVGLVHVLGNLSNPSSLGPAIASAFTATLWGVLSANLIWLPISNKLKRSHALEVQVKHMVIEGMLSLQAGATSRVVRTKMEAFLAPEMRGSSDEVVAA